MTTAQVATRTIYFSIGGNILLALIKWLTGHFGNSFALIADAIESTVDIFSSIIILIGLRYSMQPADKNHPYGHGRAEPLVTFATVAFLVSSAILIIKDSIQNIQTPHELPAPFTLFVLGGIILWKEISFRFVQYRSKAIGSSSLAADAWHHRSDAISSLTAFIGISVALFLGKGYEAADDWAALAGAGIILYNSYLIFRPALGEIMDENVYDSMIEEIRKLSLEIPAVEGTEKCFIRKTGMTFQVELHVLVDGKRTVIEGHEIAHTLKDLLKTRMPQLDNVLIHIEPFVRTT